MKYNLSEIMKEAWKTFKQFQKFIPKLPFSECLTRAWKKAKEAVKAEMLIKKLTETGEYFYMYIGMSSVHVNLGDGVVSGNTYKCKDILKEYGLSFNGSEKYWEGSREDIAALVKVYA